MYPGLDTGLGTGRDIGLKNRNKPQIHVASSDKPCLVNLSKSNIYTKIKIHPPSIYYILKPPMLQCPNPEWRQISDPVSS